MIVLHALARSYGGAPADFFSTELSPLERFAINCDALKAGGEEEMRARDEQREAGEREAELARLKQSL